MRTPSKKLSIGIGVLSTVLLIAGFFLVTDTRSIVDSAGVPYTPKVDLMTKPVKSDAQFYITVANDITDEANNLDPETARQRCEATAYNTDHMWKQVTCVYEGETIYDDVFIAG